MNTQQLPVLAFVRGVAELLPVSRSAYVILAEKLIGLDPAAPDMTLLRFRRWPLRELVHAYSRETNDAAQILFAVYLSIAISAATRTHGRLAAEVLAHRWSACWRTEREAAWGFESGR